MHMKTTGFIFAAILCAAIMFGTVIAAANAGMTRVVATTSSSATL
jgi:hypothetical protein